MSEERIAKESRLAQIQLPPGSVAASDPRAPASLRRAAQGPVLVREEAVIPLERWLGAAGATGTLQVQPLTLEAVARPIRAFAKQAWLLEMNQSDFPLQLTQLAPYLPEELDPDPVLRDFALAVVVDAVAQRLVSS